MPEACSLARLKRSDLDDAAIDRDICSAFGHRNPEGRALDHSGKKGRFDSRVRSAALFNFQIDDPGLLYDFGLGREQPSLCVQSGKRIGLQGDALDAAHELGTPRLPVEIHA